MSTTKYTVILNVEGFPEKLKEQRAMERIICSIFPSVYNLRPVLTIVASTDKEMDIELRWNTKITTKKVLEYFKKKGRLNVKSIMFHEEVSAEDQAIDALYEECLKKTKMNDLELLEEERKKRNDKKDK